MGQRAFTHHNRLSSGRRRKLVVCCALGAIMGALYFVVAVAVLQPLRPELNPVTHAVSNYAVGPFGFLMTAAFFGLGFSAFALAIGVAHALAPTWQAHISTELLRLTGIGLIVTGIFPGDTTSAHPPGSTTSLIHWLAAGTSFLFFMVATFLLSSAFKSDVRWQSFRRLSLANAVVIVLALAILGASAMVGRIGVGERIYLGACIVWLLLASARLLSITAREAS